MTSKLFTPLTVGRLQLAHRIVLAPLTRYRANSDHVHGDLAVTYYEQRASTPGSLLITEATFIAAEAGGYRNIPGIWTPDQISGWKRVTDAVHAKRSFIFLQLWALGRAANPKVLKQKGNLPFVSSSNVPLTGKKEAPTPLTKDEIAKFVGLYAQAAKNAIAAGFDGVEIHGANGYLIDQFTQDTANTRTDEYGGSIENRARFALEVAKAVTDAVGEDRTGIRLSPWSRFQGLYNVFQDMREKEPIPTFSYLIQQLHDRFPQLAYLHLVEPVVKGDKDDTEKKKDTDSNDFARKIWGDRPLIVAGGFQPDSAIATAEEKGGLIAFGRHFLANPDLPKRIELKADLNPYNRDTFYVPESPVGYIDYPFLNEQSTRKIADQAKL